MATKKITQLDSLASGSVDPTVDVLPIVNIATDSTDKITVDDLKGGMGLAPITSNDSKVFIEKSTKISEPVGTAINLDLKQTGNVSFGDMSYINVGYSGSNPAFGPPETILSKIGLGNIAPVPKTGGGIQFFIMPSTTFALANSTDQTQIFAGMYPSDQTFRSSNGMVIGNSTPSPYGTLHIIPENWVSTIFELRPYVANFDAVNRGVRFPPVTEANRDAMSGMEGGTVIFNDTTSKLQVWTGSAWVDLH